MFDLTTNLRALRAAITHAGSQAVDVRLVTTAAELEVFLRFPWRVYPDDPQWVPPLRSGFRDKLTPGRDPFWRNAERALFLAWRGLRPVGTVAAILDHGRNTALGVSEGVFGFFESEDDPEVARALLEAVARWHRARGMTAVVGPFNPSISAEHGLLVEGHDTRPAMMEAHTPKYYPALVEACGFTPWRQSYAWLVTVENEKRELQHVLPEKVFEVAKRARGRADVKTRPVDLTRWDAEVGLIHGLYNEAMSTVDDFTPLSEEDFRALSSQFRDIVDPELVRLVEVGGKPVAFALCLPDFNEALKHADGALFPTGALKVWWHAQTLTRASFKILVVLEEHRKKGLEVLLILEIAQHLLDAGYTEADLSHTGEENLKINFYLAAMGFRIYRRYQTYRRELSP